MKTSNIVDTYEVQWNYKWFFFEHIISINYDLTVFCSNKLILNYIMRRFLFPIYYDFAIVFCTSLQTWQNTLNIPSVRHNFVTKNACNGNYYWRNDINTVIFQKQYYYKSIWMLCNLDYLSIYRLITWTYMSIYVF